MIQMHIHDDSVILVVPVDALLKKIHGNTPVAAIIKMIYIIIESSIAHPGRDFHIFYGERKKKAQENLPKNPEK